MSNVLRNIPSVNDLLESPPLKRAMEIANRTAVVSTVRQFLDNLRHEVQTAATEVDLPTPAELAERIARWITDDQTPNLRPVINATGILLHTGLGRAPLAASALDAVVEVARGYAAVEVDVDSGQRTQRVADVERMLRRLTGAEAAVVVNNNAGATLLALAALAAGKEVIVSRGHLVEIGGSYRLPEVMEFSGARLREVGTTNKTRIDDYRRAIGPETAAVMRVHTSNYAIVGFTEQTALTDLVDLGRKHQVIVIDDLGSGALHDLAEWGIKGEPTVANSVHSGADVILFSGDKLVGGPQCGIILGGKQHVDRIRKHPLMRALRVDKLTLAALYGTLQLHQSRERAQQTIPLYELLSTSMANLQNRAERLAPQIEACATIAEAQAVAATTYLGGGSLPMQEIQTWCIAVRPAKGTLDGLAKSLRKGTPALFGRIQKDRLLLDLRTVFPRQDLELVEAIRRLSSESAEEEAEDRSLMPEPDIERPV